jgi:hypothetical protein
LFLFFGVFRYLILADLKFLDKSNQEKFTFFLCYSLRQVLIVSRVKQKQPAAQMDKNTHTKRKLCHQNKQDFRSFRAAKLDLVGQRARKNHSQPSWRRTGRGG